MNDYLVLTCHKLEPEGGRPLEFLISTSDEVYLDLNHCYLTLKCQVTRADWTLTKTTKKTDLSRGQEALVGPVKLLFHSLLRQVDLVMNDVLAATSGDMYPYGAYLTMLLSYRRHDKGTWLRRLEGCFTDEEIKCDAEDN